MWGTGRSVYARLKFAVVSAPVAAALLCGCSSPSSGGVAHSSAPSAAATPTPGAHALVTSAFGLLRQTTHVRAIVDATISGVGRAHSDISYYGKDFRGTTTLNGVTDHVRFVDKTGYLNAPAAYLKMVLGTVATSHPGGLAAISNRWVTGPTTSAVVRQSGALSKLTKFAAQSPSAAAWVTPTTRNGKPVYDVYDANGDHYIVAASGKPYLLQLTGFDSGQPAQLTFSDYGSTTPVTAPTDVLHLRD